MGEDQRSKGWEPADQSGGSDKLKPSDRTPEDDEDDDLGNSSVGILGLCNLDFSTIVIF